MIKSSQINLLLEQYSKDNKYSHNSFGDMIFDWNDWDQLSTAAFVYYECTLKVDLCEYRSGEKFDCIEVDYETSNIRLVKDHMSLYH